MYDRHDLAQVAHVGGATAIEVARMLYDFILTHQFGCVALEQFHHSRIVLHRQVAGQRYDFDASAHGKRSGAQTSVHLLIGVRYRLGGASPDAPFVPDVCRYRIDRCSTSGDYAV